MRARTILVAVAALLLAAGAARANVFNMGGVRDPLTGKWTGLASLETVYVGDPGNIGEPSGVGSFQDASGPYRICGAVAYTYNIGEYEVTAGQYCEFLNAVAQVDTYGLYNSKMAIYDSRITRIGDGTIVNPFSYSVATDTANRPVNYVSWGDAARFANWLQNGQPEGAQDLSTTEDGSYYLNGATTDAALLAVTRKPGATWAIPSEDEWFKAAYYKGGSANEGYWAYPTRQNTHPGQDMADVSGHNANYITPPEAWPIDPGDNYPTTGHYTTVVGEFQNSTSPYGTFDQAGNVMEWNEAILMNRDRGARGGAYDGFSGPLLSSHRSGGDLAPTREEDYLGFRVALVPEPPTMAILLFGGVGMLRWRPWLAAAMRS